MTQNRVQGNESPDSIQGSELLSDCQFYEKGWAPWSKVLILVVSFNVWQWALYGKGKGTGKGKGKIFHVLLTQHCAIRKHWGSGGIAPCILHFGTR